MAVKFVVKKGSSYWGTTAASWVPKTQATVFTLFDAARRVALKYGGKVVAVRRWR